MRGVISESTLTVCTTVRVLKAPPPRLLIATSQHLSVCVVGVFVPFPLSSPPQPRPPSSDVYHCLSMQPFSPHFAGLKSYSCNDCGKRFFLHSQLAAHLVNHHRGVCLCIAHFDSLLLSLYRSCITISPRPTPECSGWPHSPSAFARTVLHCSNFKIYAI